MMITLLYSVDSAPHGCDHFGLLARGGFSDMQLIIILIIINIYANPCEEIDLVKNETANTSRNESNHRCICAHDERRFGRTEYLIHLRTMFRGPVLPHQPVIMLV
jgi:hypothetical protein